jgi:hypothetical protein
MPGLPRPTARPPASRVVEGNPRSTSALDHAARYQPHTQIAGQRGQGPDSSAVQRLGRRRRIGVRFGRGCVQVKLGVHQHPGLREAPQQRLDLGAEPVERLVQRVSGRLDERYRERTGRRGLLVQAPVARPVDDKAPGRRPRRSLARNG